MRWLALLALLATGCRDGRSDQDHRELVFVYQPLGRDDAALDTLIGEGVRKQVIPNASDVAHQYFLTALEGGSTAFDVFVIDVVWVPEFARAGWIADLSDAFPPEALARDFLEGPARAVTFEGRTWAVPWYLDAGLLYYRTDLVPRAPRTYAELEQFAKAARTQEIAGYTWQGRQYEGLVCNVFEAMWGHGATTQQGDRVVIDTPEAQAGLAYLRRLIETGASPTSVTSAAEEEARRLFQAGRAAMMRNWPYAWDEANAEGSPIRNKVAFAPLPTQTGEPGSGTLGGWQLAVNAHLPPERRRRAIELVRRLTTPKAMATLALTYGRNPTRRAVYEDPELAARAPFIQALRPIFERARPRPVTPYYGLMSDAIQSEFSAAISGLREPKEALQRLQPQLDRLAGAKP